jgi:hypothetical protein
MGRENCSMCDYLGDTKYCGYYDVFFMKCEQLADCPENLDYDEENEDEDYNPYDE